VLGILANIPRIRGSEKIKYLEKNTSRKKKLTRAAQHREFTWFSNMLTFTRDNREKVSQ
jgi:hypothetical protein